MTIEQMLHVLDAEKIPRHWFSLHEEWPERDAIDCLRKTSEGKWEVYVGERGLKSDLLFFKAEHDACMELIARLRLQKRLIDEGKASSW